MNDQIKISEISAVDPQGVRWVWKSESFQDDDRRNLVYHWAENAVGETKPLPFSDFRKYSPRHFQMLVEYGFPARPGPVICNWSPAELDALLARKEAA